MKTLDLKIIRKCSEGDKELFASMLKIIVEEFSEFQDQIPGFVYDKNWPHLIYLMDKLCDVSVYCGTEKVEHLAREAFGSLRHNNFIEAQTYMKDLPSQIETALYEVKKIQSTLH